MKEKMKNHVSNLTEKETCIKDQSVTRENERCLKDHSLKEKETCLEDQWICKN